MSIIHGPRDFSRPHGKREDKLSPDDFSCAECKKKVIPGGRPHRCEPEDPIQLALEDRINDERKRRLVYPVLGPSPNGLYLAALHAHEKAMLFLRHAKTKDDIQAARQAIRRTTREVEEARGRMKDLQNQRGGPLPPRIA